MNTKEAMKIVAGNFYMNIHTKEKCMVIDKIFFNVVYIKGELSQSGDYYVHYKTFLKNWKAIKEDEYEETTKV